MLLDCEVECEALAEPESWVEPESLVAPEESLELEAARWWWVVVPVEDPAAATVVVWVVWPSAGSWPVTSCTNTAPLAARNVASDMPATRRRIARARCRRAASFSLAAARRLR